jgi:hypothetical protein
VLGVYGEGVPAEDFALQHQDRQNLSAGIINCGECVI